MASPVKSKHAQHHRKYRTMLCSLSSHDQVSQPVSPRRHSTASSSSSTSTSSSTSGDPSSPRVGCMGQVKMSHCNLVGFPAPISGCDSTSNMSSSMVKYINFRLKGLFSTRALITHPTSVIRAAVGGAHKAKTGRVRNIHIDIKKETQMEQHDHPRPPRNSTGSRVVLCRCSIDDNDTSNNEKGRYCMVNLEKMDPPLPVVKRALNQQEQDEKSSSLWQRRSGGVPLKRIQICQVMIQQKARFSIPAETV